MSMVWTATASRVAFIGGPEIGIEVGEWRDDVDSVSEDLEMHIKIQRESSC